MKVYVPDHGHINKRQFCVDHGIGLLYSPHRPLIPKVKDYIVDNGAFPAYRKGERLDLIAYYSYLSKLRDAPYKPAFIVIPDIVGVGLESYELSCEHIGKIPEGFKKYFAVQDGQYQEPIREVIDLVDGLFVGGTIAWKLNTARSWVDFAHENRKKCHIGRFTRWRNLFRAMTWGADSVDGSTAVRNNKLDELSRHLKELRDQKYINKEDWIACLNERVYQNYSNRVKP